MDTHLVTIDPAIVWYYLSVWTLDSLFFIVSSIMAGKLASQLPFSRAARSFHRIAIVTGMFALLRIITGADSVFDYFAGYKTAIATVVYLSVTSATLNTLFIIAVVVVLYLEVRYIENLNPQRKELVAHAAQAFEDLKTVTEIHRTDG